MRVNKFQTTCLGSIFSIVIFSALAFSSNNVVYAHPGNTAADGCHYCWTNCDYWGEIYGQRHCHGGYSAPSYSAPVSSVPSDWDQGEQNGAIFAETKNRSYIESNASQEGTSDGSADGYVAGSPTPASKAESFCAQEVTFTTPPSLSYKLAHQASYKKACIPIYNAAYNTAYSPAYTQSKSAYDDAQKIKALEIQEMKEAAHKQNVKKLWAVVASVLLLFIAAVAWDSKNKEIKKLFK